MLVLKAIQPAPKYHTKGCSHSSVDSPGARTLVFAAFEPFHSCEFRASIARTPFYQVKRSQRLSPKGAILPPKSLAFFLATQTRNLEKGALEKGYLHKIVRN